MKAMPTRYRVYAIPNDEDRLGEPACADACEVEATSALKAVALCSGLPEDHWKGCGPDERPPARYRGERYARRHGLGSEPYIEITHNGRLWHVYAVRDTPASKRRHQLKKTVTAFAFALLLIW